MPDPPQTEVTRILLDLSAQGDAAPPATGRLFDLVYDELRSLAGAYMRRERAEHTLQATALVHEAFLRLVDQTQIEWQNRAHFMGIAARAMRQTLIDHARRKSTEKRGGGWERVTLDEGAEVGSERGLDVIELDEALCRFAALDDRAARVVELRVFGGMTVEESAHVLGVSPRTVDNDWSVARMWLTRELSGESP